MESLYKGILIQNQNLDDFKLDWNISNRQSLGLMQNNFNVFEDVFARSGWCIAPTNK